MTLKTGKLTKEERRTKIYEGANKPTTPNSVTPEIADNLLSAVISDV